jgi:predicted secreted protein
MTITSAIVLFASIWALVFFMVLPFGQVSQHEAGEVVPGTPASAPSDAMIKRKMLITTGIAVVAFAVVYWILTSGVITLDDIPFLTPPSGR